MKDEANISIFRQTPDAPLPSEIAFEPGFEYSRALNPDYADPQWCEGLVRHLDRLIRRTPNDLTTHVQRINALLAAGFKGERVFAAALDLNTVLGSNGLALQKRIHEQIFDVLDDQQRSALVAIRSGAALPPSPAESFCALPRNSGQTVPLVSKNQAVPVGESPQIDFDIGA